MGNDILRVDSLNINQKRELTGQAHNIVRYVEEDPSIWTNLDPTVLGSTAVFALLLQRKEFKNIKPIGATYLEKCNTSRNFVKLNEINHLAEHFNLSKASDLAKAQKEVLLNEIGKARAAQTVSSSTVAQLSKDYYKLLDSQLTNKSFFEKGLTKIATKSPGLGGSALNFYKNNKLMLFITELIQEWSDVSGAFAIKDENAPNQKYNMSAGCTQIVKSTGRVAAGLTGFVAAGGVGAHIGAAIGSLIPGAGTFIGGVLGYALGYGIGYIGSQLARKAYNSVIKSECEIAKEKSIEKIYNMNDKSQFATEALTNELEKHANYIASAEHPEQNPFVEYTNENIAAVKSNYQVLKDLYKAKYGTEYIAQTAKSETTNPDATKKQAVTETTTAQAHQSATEPAQTTQKSYQAYQPNMFTQQFNQNFMTNSPQVDWSARLPMQLQNQYFTAVC